MVRAKITRERCVGESQKGGDVFPCHSIVQTAQEGRRLCGSLHGDILTDSNASKLQDRSQQSFAVFVSVCAGLSLHRTDPRDIYLALTLLLSQQTLFNVMWARFTMDAAQVTQRWRLHFLIRNRSLTSSSLLADMHWFVLFSKET